MAQASPEERLRGCVAAWLRGCVAAWLRGCVAAWLWLLWLRYSELCSKKGRRPRGGEGSVGCHEAEVSGEGLA